MPRAYDVTNISFSPSPLRASSLSLDNALWASVSLDDTCLPYESLSSIPSLSYLDSGDVPPFPTRLGPAMIPLLGLGGHLVLYPNGLSRIDPCRATNKDAIVIVSIPTPPRLRTMLKEDLCVGRWAESLPAAPAPGHVPWGGVDEADGPDESEWVPEGSLFSREAFRAALAESRRNQRPRNTPAARGRTASTPSRSLRARSCFPISPSFREALVFEREIPLDTDGKTKHWSLQVPANEMDPEMVDMMLELQHLNLFFKEDGLDTEGPFDHSGLSQLGPPALMVSNSTSEMPISLSSSVNLAPESTLAARRGRKAPAALTFTKNPEEATEQDPYPSMPTAFLSPAAYDPGAHPLSNADSPSLGLAEMVANLRAKCASMCRFPTPEFPVLEATGLPLADEQEAEMIDSDEEQDQRENVDEDEWAFAKGLVGSCGLDALKTDVFHNPSAVAPDRPIDNGLDSYTAMPELALDQPVGQYLDPYLLASRTPPHLSPQSSQPPSILKDRPSLLTEPPCSPLPPRPPSVGSASGRTSAAPPRGILKSCKNVRFASLPSRTGAGAPDFLSEPPQIRGSRHSTGTATTTSPPSTPRWPSPLRRTFMPAPILARPSGNSNPAPRSASGPAAFRKTSLSFSSAESGRPISTLPSKSQDPTVIPSSLTAPAPAVLRPRNGGKWTTASSKKPTQLQTASVLTRPFSLGRSTGGRMDENRARATSSPPIPSPRASSAGEKGSRSSLRRNSVLESGAQKSRMPVPLRNIFTRFK